MSTPASLLKSMQTADGIGLTATKTTKHNQTAATKSTKPATKKKEKQTEIPLLDLFWMHLMVSCFENRV